MEGKGGFSMPFLARSGAEMGSTAVCLKKNVVLRMCYICVKPDRFLLKSFGILRNSGFFLLARL